MKKYQNTTSFSLFFKLLRPTKLYSASRHTRLRTNYKNTNNQFPHVTRQNPTIRLNNRINPNHRSKAIRHHNHHCKEQNKENPLPWTLRIRREQRNLLTGFNVCKMEQPYPPCLDMTQSRE